MALETSRRAFVKGAAGILATPCLSRKVFAQDVIKLRCSLDTAPSHPRNQAITDYLDKLDQASNGKIKSELFHSGQLFADLNVTKALIQGQIDMAAPGTWTMTGLVPDSDFCQLPALYSPSIDVFRRCSDGAPGELVGKQIEAKLRSHILGHWLELGFENWYTTRKPIVKSIGGSNEIWPFHMVPAQLKNFTPVGIAISIEVIANAESATGPIPVANM